VGGGVLIPSYISSQPGRSAFQQYNTEFLIGSAMIKEKDLEKVLGAAAVVQLPGSYQGVGRKHGQVVRGPPVLFVHPLVQVLRGPEQPHEAPRPLHGLAGVLVVRQPRVALNLQANSRRWWSGCSAGVQACICCLLLCVGATGRRWGCETWETCNPKANFRIISITVLV